MSQTQLESRKPRIWVLTGAKGGDNAQVLRAADATGLAYETRHFVMRPEFEIGKPAVSASLHHIDVAKSDRLEAPWPDVAVTIGRRLSMVALWIKQQSGGKTRVALLNAPKGDHRHFDLIVAPAYYNLPDDPRLCRIELPLLGLDKAAIEAARSRFAGTIGAMPKPLTVVLLGGGTRTMRLDVAAAEDILRKVRAGQSGGSIYVSTSRRTAPDIAPALAPLLHPSGRIYHWTTDPSENPYLGLLAHGDRFVVTGDSISMIVEVARLGLPLSIAELPRVNMFLSRVARGIGLPDTQSRDFGKLHAFLYDRNLAVRLGETPSAVSAPLGDDTARVAARLHQLSGLA